MTVRSVRKFYFENERSERYALNDSRVRGLALNPEGLGLHNEAAYVRLGDQFARDYFRNAQGTISLEIANYGDKSYIQYRKMIDFILAAKRLRLIYTVPMAQDEEYYRDVDIYSIDKTEIKELNRLTVPVTLTCKSLWYKAHDTIYAVEVMEGETRYDMRYDMMFNDNSALGFTLNNAGHVDAAIQVTIEGYSEYPQLSVTAPDGTMQTISFAYIIDTGDLLHYSSVDGNLFAYIDRADGSREDIFPALLDSGQDIFIKAKPGASTVGLSSITGLLGKSVVRALIYFRTV